MKFLIIIFEKTVYNLINFRLVIWCLKWVIVGIKYYLLKKFKGWLMKKNSKIVF